MRLKRHNYKSKPNNFLSLIGFFHPSNWKKILLLGLGFAIFFIALGVIYTMYFLPPVDRENSEELAFAESTIIYDRGALEPGANPIDHVLYTIHGEENREYLPLEEFSPWLAKATMAIEDDDFYSHLGFDIGGLVKAVMHEVFGIGPKRGGSTITQQLAKNVFLSRDRTFSRKFKELFLAFKLEATYSKDDILELYLNKIPYGNNAHGAEAAAKTFFGKSARDLSIAEAAILASLPVAPTRFSPFGANKDLLLGANYYDEETGKYGYRKGRKDLVLQRMLALGLITDEEFSQAWGEAKAKEFTTYRTDIKAPHFVFQVRERLEQKYGQEFLRQGGLKIYTTLDREMQDEAELIVSQKGEYYGPEFGAQNIALVGIDNNNGEILTYIGGRDFFNKEIDGQVDVLTSRRQPGSSFKPLVFASAFEQGYSPASVLFDVETDFGGNYRPSNFNGEYQGPVSLRTSLNESLNIPSIKAAYLAGPQKILDTATVLGIKYEGTAKQHNVALGVGVAEVEPLSHINSLQAFAGDGSYYEPSFILEIHDSAGNVLEKIDHQKKKKEGLDPEIAALVRNIITDASTRPTTDDFSWNKLLDLGKYNNGAKTGTSNRVAANPEFNPEEPEDEDENPKLITVPGDSWTVGFTPHLVTGVWVGNNRGEPMNPGATGLAVAAPIWKSFNLAAHEILVKNGADPKKLYNEPKPLTVKTINKYSGKLATEETPEELRIDEYFASFNIPTELDDSIQEIEIDRRTGRPIEDGFTSFSTVKRKTLKLQSIRPDMANWQNPVDEWIKNHPKFIASLGVIFDEDSDDELALLDDELASLDPSNPTKRRLSRWDTRILSRDPSVIDPSGRNVPKISIISPKKGSNLAPGEVEIQVAASARFGVEGVEFYYDGRLADSASIAPFTGKFEIPTQTDLGSIHTIKAVVFDRAGSSSEAEVEVQIDVDTVGPEIIFLGPLGGQKIPYNTTVQILTNIFDRSSAVREFSFFLDEVPLNNNPNGSYGASFVAQGRLGRHTIKAVAIDVHGNITEKSIPVIFERERLFVESKPMISKIDAYRASAMVELVFPFPEKIEFAEIIVSQEGEIVFYQKIDEVTKFAQIQVPKSFEGSASIQLLSKYQEESGPYESPTKSLEW